MKATGGLRRWEGIWARRQRSGIRSGLRQDRHDRSTGSQTAGHGSFLLRLVAMTSAPTSPLHNVSIGDLKGIRNAGDA